MHRHNAYKLTAFHAHTCVPCFVSLLMLAVLLGEEKSEKTDFAVLLSNLCGQSIFRFFRSLPVSFGLCQWAILWWLIWLSERWRLSCMCLLDR
ncbi:hypothetical protein BDY21DRAFT_130455 [Lineolata rhizophorae]|uniref:Uncharacterized protein n=1 Tax=Lineolata rhizophorae TaxID=578093 RepID=A0A6A6NNV2_9PEZI|nr:hypothetical protein BDY21DRAFT_130455 [Lineolata rhizophorae]